MITIDTLKDKIENNSRLLGLDMGSKRIGVSICDDRRKIATPYKTIEFINIENLIFDLSNIVKENDIFGIIIGNPVNMDGSHSQSSQSAKDLAINLSKDITKNVTLWDERLSSEGAFKLSHDLVSNTSKKVSKLDQNSAQFILQGALDYLTKKNT